jgi:ABC-type multidrug transport system fused ATPase/permease subunit
MEKGSLDDLSPGSTKHWFWGTIFKSWRIYRDVLVASFLINVFGLASPFFVLIVYDRVIPNNAVETLWVLSIGIMVIYLFTVAMRGLRGYFVDEAGKRADLKMSAMLLQKVLGLKLEVRPQSIGSFAGIRGHPRFCHLIFHYLSDRSPLHGIGPVGGLVYRGQHRLHIHCRYRIDVSLCRPDPVSPAKSGWKYIQGLRSEKFHFD